MFSSQHLILRKLLQVTNNDHLAKKISTHSITSSSPVHHSNHTNNNHLYQQQFQHVINDISKKTKGNLFN